MVVPFQVGFTTVFKPLVVVLNGTANKVIRSLGIEPKEELSGARSAEELSFLVRHSAQAGLLEPHDATLLDRTLRFSALDAADVMTPRVQMTSVPVDAPAADVVAASLASGHSRLPVIDEGPDDVVGVVHVKQAWAVAPDQRDRTPVRDLMSSPGRVPESMGADALLALLRAEGFQLAVVTDEYGGTAGIVTLEDLVEEIVGELEDEFDRTRPEVMRRGRSVVFDAVPSSRRAGRPGRRRRPEVGGVGDRRRLCAARAAAPARARRRGRGRLRGAPGGTGRRIAHRPAAVHPARDRRHARRGRHRP